MRKNIELLGIFMLLFFIGFSSATISFSGVPTTLSQNTTSFSFNVSSDLNETVNLSISGISNLIDSASSIVFGLSNFQVVLNDSNNRIANIVVSISKVGNFDFRYDQYSTSLTAIGNASVNTLNSNIKFQRSNYRCITNDCNDNFLDVVDFEFDLFEGIGDEDDGFYPLDVMKIEFTVENEGSDDVENIDLFVCVYDKSTSKCIFDEDDFEFSDDGFDIDEDDDLDIIGTLFLNPDNLKAGNENYILFVTAKGEINSDGSLDGVSTYGYLLKEFKIITKDEFVILGEVELLNPVVNCGENVKISSSIWNVGDKDIDSDELFLYIYSKDLKIDDIVEFSSDLDAMDFLDFEYSFNVPSGLTEGKDYLITFEIFSDDSIADKYLYENGQDTKAKYVYYLKVNGKCVVMEPVINARLTGNAVVGEEMSINVNIVNPEKYSVNYKASISDYDSSLASLLSLNPETFTLLAGASTSLNVKFEPIGSGQFDFNIKLTDSEGNVYTQPVSVDISGTSNGFDFSFDNELFLYGLVGLLVIFVLLLLVLVIVASKKHKPLKTSEII